MMKLPMLAVISFSASFISNSVLADDPDVPAPECRVIGEAKTCITKEITDKYNCDPQPECRAIYVDHRSVKQIMSYEINGHVMHKFIVKKIPYPDDDVDH